MYTHVIMNQDQDYMWRNKFFTNNKICISRTFDATDPTNENKINTWLEKFRLPYEGIKNIIITVDGIFEEAGGTIVENPNAFNELSKTQPILIIINDGVSTLFVPVIEYVK